MLGGVGLISLSCTGIFRIAELFCQSGFAPGISARRSASQILDLRCGCACELFVRLAIEQIERRDRGAHIIMRDDLHLRAKIEFPSVWS